LNLTTHRDARALGQVLLGRLDDFLNLRGDTSEIGTRRELSTVNARRSSSAPRAGADLGRVSAQIEKIIESPRRTCQGSRIAMRGQVQTMKASFNGC